MEDRVIGQILGTVDLKKFKVNELNRSINRKHVNELMRSILDVGKILQPIIVDGDFNILEGHHRVFASLGLMEQGYKIEMPYIIDTDVDTVKAMTTINSNTKVYGTKDFIDLYAKAQDGQSRKLIKVAENIDESPVTLLSVISCGSDVARNKEKIKNDEFIDFEEWDLVEEFYEFLKGIKPYVHLTTKTKQMLFRIFQIENFKFQIFGYVTKRVVTNN